MTDLILPQATETQKTPWQSKTLWTNALLAVFALFVPGVSDYLKTHPEVLTVLFTAANFILRFFTHQRLGMQD